MSDIIDFLLGMSIEIVGQIPTAFIALVLVVTFLLYQLIKGKNQVRADSLANINDIVQINKDVSAELEKLDEQFEKLHDCIEKYYYERNTDDYCVVDALKNIHSEMLVYLKVYTEFLLDYLSLMKYGLKLKYRLVYLRNKTADVIKLYKSVYRCCYTDNRLKEELEYLVFRYQDIEILYCFINRRFFRSKYIDSEIEELIANLEEIKHHQRST